MEILNIEAFLFNLVNVYLKIFCFAKECIVEKIRIDEEIMQDAYYRIHCDIRKDLFQVVILNATNLVSIYSI